MLLIEKLENFVIPKTISSGCFGSNAKFEGYEVDVYKCEDNFASEIIFVKIYVRFPEKDNAVKSFEVLIKFQLLDDVYRRIVNSKFQFENEILMYTEILPVLDNGHGTVQDLFCRYFYGYIDPDDSTKDFIVLEDLRQYGYRPSKERVFLDVDHCSLALRELGKFHALSYLAKQNNINKLLSLVSKIKEKWTEKSVANCKELLELNGQRGVKPVIDSGEQVELLNNYLKNYDDPVKYYQNLVDPSDPSTVLCHGDFNRNNMCFKYDNDKPVSVKFIDLQTPRYCSPIIDLSFFLYMNTTEDLREKHWDDLIEIYSNSLLSATGLTKAPNLDWTKAVYGYLHCSFFLPAMLVKSDVSQVLFEDPHQAAMVAYNRGGEEETKILADIVRHLVRRGFLKASYL